MDAARYFLNLAKSAQNVCLYNCDQGDAYLINSFDVAKKVLTSPGFGCTSHPFLSLRPLLSPSGLAWLGIENSASESDALMQRVQKFFDFYACLDTCERALGTNLLPSAEFYFDVKAMFFSLSTSILFNFNLSTDATDIAYASDLIENIRSGSDSQGQYDQHQTSLNQELATTTVLRHLATRIQRHCGRDPVEYLTHAIIETLLNATVPLAYSFLWTLVLLGRQESIQHMLWNEGMEKGSGDSLFLSFPQKLAYTTVIKESLRLYPPVWAIGRTCMETQILSGATIRQGEPVVVSPYALHRSPVYWSRSNIFHPDRFRANASQTYGFMPFGVGVKRCPAARWNIPFLSLALRWFLNKYSISVGKLPQHFSLVALRPSSSFSASIRARHNL
ncbi:hypothetical protein R69658_07916 [Paraburkholderia aspalathi]|uniref:Cytochrome P450 n=1 Tax=Paraburkholderia aspalathi TaxID=1324617 RepID=A0ABM8T8Z4_9BURK|nr:cytochrome P450 [Paraburkholderia aspalathi]MBK3824167.1 cytochrome P450 [Paraburkholderia aspalathi]MBK3836005.1 cytochrome P450 [Paraburkholderia aspalathi]MBK3865779.1 cytochrome P450 [Paraburkholderia aspalathi]CAE6866933.1 hypothetical protein R69658_07916 [Paraburkholderia aspalathi]